MLLLSFFSVFLAAFPNLLFYIFPLSTFSPTVQCGWRKNKLESLEATLVWISGVLSTEWGSSLASLKIHQMPFWYESDKLDKYFQLWLPLLIGFQIIWAQTAQWPRFPVHFYDHPDSKFEIKNWLSTMSWMEGCIQSLGWFLKRLLQLFSAPVFFFLQEYFDQKLLFLSTLQHSLATASGELRNPPNPS